MDAAKELGFTDVQEDTIMIGYQGKTKKVDVVLKTGTGYDIGLVKDNDKYTLEADWWGVKQKKQPQEFTKALNGRSLNESNIGKVFSQYTTKNHVQRIFKEKGWQNKVSLSQDNKLKVECLKY